MPRDAFLPYASFSYINSRRDPHRRIVILIVILSNTVAKANLGKITNATASHIGDDSESVHFYRSKLYRVISLIFVFYNLSRHF